jgi:hypothetical protein
MVHCLSPFVQLHPGLLASGIVGRINHVQGTRPNAVSAFRTFVEYILCAYTHINKTTFTYYATSILYYNLRVVLRVPGKPTLISLHLD